MSKIGWKRDGFAPAKLRWTDAVLVCGKCLKRSGDGKAIRRALRDELVAQSEEEARVRIVRTACLGLCPKNGVVVASGADLAAGRAIVLRGPGGVAAAVSHLHAASRLSPPKAVKDIS